MHQIYASPFAASHPFLSSPFAPQAQGGYTPAAHLLPALFPQSDQFGLGANAFSPEMMGMQWMMMMALQQQLALMFLAHLLTSGAGQNNGGQDRGRMNTPQWGSRRNSPRWNPRTGGPNGSNGTNGPAAMPRTNGTYEPGRTYPPGSPEARALFREAAQRAGLPPEWGDSPALHNILRRESGGQVGRPNYTYGSRARNPSQWSSIHAELQQGRKTTRSSATGLGQLLLANVDRYYPSGRAGIGDPLEEATGMLNYIKDRYGSPERAWQLYGVRHEGY